MKQFSLDSKLIYLALGTFILVYLLTFPTGWLISDVYSYMNQGIALADGEEALYYKDAITQELIAYSGTRYPLGNAFWIALWTKICGLKYVYAGSLFSIVLGVLLILRVLQKGSFFKLSALLLFIYPSLVFLVIP